MEFNREDVEQFLTETEEGKQLVEQMKEPLLSKRDELFSQMKTLKSELENLKLAENERVNEVETQKREKQEQKLKSENDFEAYKKFHEEEVSKYKTELNSFQKKYAQKEADRVIAETAMRYSKAPKPLQLLLRERIKPVINDEGGIQLAIHDDDGNQMYYEGQPAKVEHLVETLKSNEEYAPFFAATGVSGSGTQQSQPVSTTSYKDMSSPEFNLSKAMGNKI